MARARQKPSGKWEIGLRHPSLPGGRKYFTFDTEAEANAYADQWRSLAESYTTAMLAGIVGLEITANEWQFAVKVSQHRPEARERLQAAYLAGNDQERALAGWMDRIAPRAT